ncbi:MAG: glycosyltransferase family 4 protein [Planctomycetota bacterium]
MALKIPRVAFVTSHPIQYQVPIFRHLADREDIDFRVLFAMLPDAAAQGDGFGVQFEWDIPLLEGYPYSVLDNVAAQPSVTQFKGCDTPGVTDVLQHERIDAVIVNGWVVKTCIQTLRACKRLGIPCIVRGEANHLRPRPWWKKLLQRQLVRRYDAFLPIGTANREFYSGYGIPESRMFDARYCIENDRFARAAAQSLPRREQLREQWGVAHDAVCFLFCGKFETKKHPLELLNAFAHTVVSHPEQRVHLLMVGDGELRQRCEDCLREQDLRVTLTGFLNQSEIVDAYVASDCLVLPSDHGETWGLVVNEAMACGKPAIVSDQVGCHRNLIRQGETGWVFEFGQWSQLSAAMAKAHEQRERLAAMGESANRLIQGYSPLAASEGMADAVRFVTENHG